MIDTNELDEILKHHEIFQGLSHEQVSWLLQISHQRDLRRGEIVFERGQDLDRLYVLLSGHVQLVIPMADTQEKVVEFLRPGDVFGESALIPQACSIARAQALNPGLVLEIERDVMLNVVERLPSFAMHLLSKLGQRIQEQIDDLESVAFKTAAQRVAEYVLRQPRLGDQARLLYHKRSIASKLGLQPETFSRSLKQLITDGLISVQGARITIHDEVKLRALVV